MHEAPRTRGFVYNGAMFEVLAFGCLGLIIGSFLNVLILRYGKNTLGGRSECPACGAQIAWYDNIPVASWLFLRGKCRRCSGRISPQYPIVELLTAAVFILVASSSIESATWTLGPHLVVAALLIAIAVYDLYHTVIPDPWVYTLVALAFVSQPLFAYPLPAGVPLWPALLGGPVAALPLFALWLVSKGRWMGFGDVKLALGMGWLLGPVYGVVAVFFAFVIGAAVSLAVLIPLPHLLRVIGRFGITPLARAPQGFTMKSEIPFGPFLVVSTFIIWILLIHSIDPLVLAGLSSRSF